MSRILIKVPLIAGLLLVLAMAGVINSPIQGQQGDRIGLFGDVTNITTPSPGITVLTLETTTVGAHEVEAAATTIVNIPGLEQASAGDIKVGDFVAVLAIEGTPSEALNILVKPPVPVTHAHITGSKVGAVGDRVSIMDKDGNVTTAELVLQGDIIVPGEVVTATVHQDLRSGSIFILGAELADVKTKRLADALDAAQAKGADQNVENLRARILENVTGHLTTLQQLVNRVDQNLKFIFSDALDRSHQMYQEGLATFSLGNPTVKIEGLILDADAVGGIVSVSQREGSKVEVKIIRETVIQLFGVETGAENLEAAQRVEVTYDFQTEEAREINVTFPTLKESVVGGLVAQVLLGELEGKVSRVDTAAEPATVTILLGNGKTVTLSTTPDTRIRVREKSAELQDLVPLALVSVKISYDQGTNEVMELETFDEQPGKEFVGGVVKSIINKVDRNIPGNSEDGNIVVSSLEGKNITLKITQGTVIQRDGLRMSIEAIRLGDMIRPSSRFDLGTRELEKIVLKSPTFKGVVRGRTKTPAGRSEITISTDQLNLVTLTATETTEVTRRNEAAALADIQVGDRVEADLVVSSAQHPITLEALKLAVQPSETLRAKGTITSLGQQFATITVSQLVGEPLDLLVPKTTKIIKDGQPGATFFDLEVGDKVTVANYRPDKIATNLVVTSE